MKQIILKVDDDFSGIPEGLNINTVGRLVGSKSWFNKILILCLSDLSVSELENAGYSVVGVEGEPLILGDLSSYMIDIIETDEDGKEISNNPFSDLKTIQTFAGRKWQ